MQIEGGPRHWGAQAQLRLSRVQSSLQSTITKNTCSHSRLKIYDFLHVIDDHSDFLLLFCHL